jgi:Lrp/AsnC family transcriptional regulator for asnA, asnC and gidA
MVRREVPVSAGERTLSALDEVDRAIVRLLQQDGRISNAAIAREVGVSEPTVKKRIDRLISERIIKVSAILNPHKSGYSCNVLIALRTRPDKTFDVGRQLARVERIVYLGYTTGRYDILAEGLFHDDADLLRFYQHDLAGIDGIVSIETSHVLESVRADYEWEPDTRSSSSGLGQARTLRSIDDGA